LVVRTCNWTAVAILIAINIICAWPPAVYAGYKDDIGYTRLSQALGGTIPDGSGIDVSQIEAKTGNPATNYMPNVTNGEFTGKTIAPQSGTSDTSGHATSVGRTFYGNSRSIAPGIGNVWCYEATDWMVQILNPNYIHVTPNPPDRPVSNHSWVGSYENLHLTSSALRKLDWIISNYDHLHFAGISNSASAASPLLGSAFNVFTIGRTDGNHSRNTAAIEETWSYTSDLVYSLQRTRPHIVTPMGTVSSSTPVGAAAAALLLEYGQNTNAERPEVIKAALMAGADRITTCGCGYMIADFRHDASNQTAHGLDSRFGAGQLNIYNSYKIVEAGEQNSAEDGGGAISLSGFDYDGSFGTQGDNDTGTYSFTADSDHQRLCATLAWHLKIGGPSLPNADATLHDLDLVLIDETAGNQIVATSSSTGDNTESLSWIPLTPGNEYRLEVRSQGSFKWDYGLAWRFVEQDTNDQDYDGFPDDQEILVNLDPSDPQDAGQDDDADGLPNFEEFCRNTDMNDPDTDGDGMDDGPEFIFWGESCSDPDGDGLPNLIDPDSDNDAYLDGPEKSYWETRDCSSWECSSCLNCDIDGDGQAKNMLDDDADGDGLLDGQDPDPLNFNEPSAAVPAVSTCGLLSIASLLIGVGAISIARRKKSTCTVTVK
jgi:hypothetical protein